MIWFLLGGIDMARRHNLKIIALAVVNVFTSAMFSSSENMSSRLDDSKKCLSSIVSEQVSRIVEMIDRERLSDNEHKEARIEHLENKKSKLINIWHAADHDQILKNLAEDLRAQAVGAKPDFATPIADTRKD